MVSNVPSKSITPPNLSFYTSMFFERRLMLLVSTFSQRFIGYLYKSALSLIYIFISFFYNELSAIKSGRNIISIKGDKI
jgi:hypothetical protein